MASRERAIEKSYSDLQTLFYFTWGMNVWYSGLIIIIWKAREYVTTK